MVSLGLGFDEAGAQERSGGSWLPENIYFRVPAVGQAEPRFTLNVISSDILDRPDGPTGRPNLGLKSGQEFQIIAGLGGTIRLWRPATWQGGVDFYSGIIYQAMGFPVELFPVLFAIPRTVGWLAQWQEMLNDPDQRIARPRQVYVGEDTRDFVPIGERG